MVPGMTLTKTSGTGAFGSNATITSIDSLTQFTFTSSNANTVGSLAFTYGGASNLTADGGGITLKGTTDKEFKWVNSTSSWTSSEHIALAPGKDLIFFGSTSGTVTLDMSTAIAGTNTIIVPALSGTMALSSLAGGGTNASLTASNGGIVYSTASAMAILAGTATAGKHLQSGASGAPSWTTSTFADTYAVNTILYAGTANTVTGLTTANSSVLVTSVSGVPSWSTTLPAVTLTSPIATTSVTINNPNLSTAAQLILKPADGSSVTISPQVGGGNFLLPTGSGTIALLTSTVANISGTLAIAQGGTGATATTGTGSNVLDTNPTIEAPTINTSITVPAASFTAFGAATTLNLGGTATSTSVVNPSPNAGTHSYSSGANTGTQVKTINFANGAIGGTTANNTVNIANGGITSTGAGFLQVNIGTGAVSATASQAINIGSTSTTARVVINNPQNAPNLQSGTTYSIPATTPTPNVVLTSATQVTLTLPTAIAGKEVRILCQGAGGVISASSNVYPKTSRTLGNAILTGAGSALLVSDGTNWQIII